MQYFDFQVAASSGWWSTFWARQPSFKACKTTWETSEFYCDSFNSLTNWIGQCFPEHFAGWPLEYTGRSFEWPFQTPVQHKFEPGDAELGPKSGVPDPGSSKHWCRACSHTRGTLFHFVSFLLLSYEVWFLGKVFVEWKWQYCQVVRPD